MTMFKTIYQKLWKRSNPDRVKAHEKFVDTHRYLLESHKRYMELSNSDSKRRRCESWYTVAISELVCAYRMNSVSKFILRRSIRIMDKIKKKYDYNINRVFVQTSKKVDTTHFDKNEWRDGYV